MGKDRPDLGAQHPQKEESAEKGQDRQIEKEPPSGLFQASCLLNRR